MASKKSSLPNDHYHLTGHKPTIKNVKVEP